jgi:hypothetical protein
MDGYRHSLFTSSLTVRFAETPEQKRKRREEKERTIIANQRKGKEGEKIHETTTPTIQTQNVTLNNSKGNAGMGGNAPWYDGAGLVPGLAGVSVPNIMTNNLDRIFRGVGNNNLLGSSLQNQLLNSVGGGSNITELMNAALSNIGNLLNHPFGFEIIMNWIKMNNLAGNMNNNNNFNHNNNALNQMDLYNFLGFLNSNVNPVNSATPSMFNLGEKKVMLTPKNIALLNLIASNQNNSPSPYLPPPIVQGEMMEKDQTTSFANSKITSGVLLNNSMGINPDSINEKASLASGFSSNASSIPPMNFLTPPATSSVPVAHGCPNAPFPKGTLSQKSLQFNTSQNTFPKMHSPPSTVANSESTSSDVFNRDDFRQSQSVLSKALTTSSVFIPRRYLGEEQMPLMNGRINNSAGITGLNQAGSYNNHNLQNHINPLINQTPQNVTPFPPGLLNYSGVNALGGTGGWANNNSGINTVASSSPHVTELGVKMGFEGPLNLSPNSCVGNVNNNLNSFLQNSLNTPQNIHPQPIICSPKVATPSFVSNTTMMQYPNPNTPIMNVDSNTTPSCFLEGGGIFNHSNNVMESGQRMSNSPGTTSFSPESPSYIGSVPFINTQQQFIPKSQHIVNPKPLTLSPMFITNSTSVTPTNPIAVSLFPSSPPQALIGDPDQSSCSLSFPSPSAPSFSLPMSSSNYLVNGNETCSHFQINNNPSLISSEAPHSGLPLIIGGDSENFDRKNVDQYSQLWTNTLEFGRGVKPSVAVNSCGGKGNEFGVGGRFGSGIKEKVNEFKDNKNDKKGVSYLDQYPPICLTSSSASGSSFSTSTSNFSGSDSSSSSQVSFSPSSSSLFGAVKNPPSQFLLKNFPRDLPLSKPTVEMLFNDLKQNRQAQIRNKNRVEKSCSPDAFTLGDFVNFVGENVGSQGLNNGGNNTHNNNTNSSIENKPDANFSFNLDHPVDEFMFNSSNTILDNGLMNNNTKINVLNQDNCFPFNMHISPFPPPLIFSDTVVKSPKMIPDMGSIPMIFNSPSHRRANYQMSSSLDNVELPTVLTTRSELICTGLPSPVTGNALLSTSPFRVSSMSVGDDQLEKEVMQPIRPATMQDNLLGYNKGTEILKKRIAGSGENASLIDGNNEQRLNEEIMKGKTSSSGVEANINNHNSNLYTMSGCSGVCKATITCYIITTSFTCEKFKAFFITILNIRSTFRGECKEKRRVSEISIICQSANFHWGE